MSRKKKELKKLLAETIYLLSIYGPDECPLWIEGIGDCEQEECKACRVFKCIDKLTEGDKL